MKKREKWNKIFSDPGAYFHKGLENNIDDILKLRPQARYVLDLGCGRGELVKYLFDKGYDVLGIDISDIALKSASQLCKADFIHYDLEKFVIPENSFDFIFLKFVYAYIDDKKKLLKKIKRGLSVDGLFILITPVMMGKDREEIAVLEKDIVLVKEIFELVEENVLLEKDNKRLIIFVFKNKTVSS